jgi:hypothetical protein
VKKFKCTVTRVDEYIIELDETILNEEFNKEFREYFYNFYDLEDHARFFAQFQARFDDESFIEGYGHITRDGKLPFSGSDFDANGNWKPEDERRKPFAGVNIITTDNAEECDVEVTEILEETI